MNERMMGAQQRKKRLEALRRQRHNGSFAAIVGPERAREWVEERRREEDETTRRRFADPAIQAAFAEEAQRLRESRPFS